MKTSNCFTRAGILALLLAPVPVRFAGLLSAQQPIDGLRPAILKDVGKSGIELPTKRLVASAAAQTIRKSEFINPKVPAGKVRWHPSYDAARKAAQKSGKPVLLFQMMGKLDDQFC
jgi:hypothetical protein